MKDKPICKNCGEPIDLEKTGWSFHGSIKHGAIFKHLKCNKKEQTNDR